MSDSDYPHNVVPLHSWGTTPILYRDLRTPHDPTETQAAVFRIRRAIVMAFGSGLTRDQRSDLAFLLTTDQIEIGKAEDEPGVPVNPWEPEADGDAMREWFLW